jgi:hypothetical protein
VGSGGADDALAEWEEAVAQLDAADLGLERARTRHLLQTELANYLLVLRALETEALALSESATGANSHAGAAGGTWGGPSEALRQMQARSPRLWAFASERLRCVEIIANSNARSPPDASAASATSTPAAAAAAASAHAAAAALPLPCRRDSWRKRAGSRRVVLWFALSDYLVEWNQRGNTGKAAELTWDAMHKNGGRVSDWLVYVKPLRRELEYE